MHHVSAANPLPERTRRLARTVDRRPEGVLLEVVVAGVALQRLRLGSPEKPARLAPIDQRILNNLALAQCRLGKYDDAYKNFARAGGELTGRLNTAVILERMGRDDEAIKQYEAARKVQPNSAVALQRLADLYRRNGRASEAEAAQSALAAN